MIHNLIELLAVHTAVWNNITCMYIVHETIKEPQLPKHEHGLNVTLPVTRCTGHVSANTRPHHLCWGDSGSVGAVVLSEFLHTVRCQSSPANLQGTHQT